MRFVRRSIVEYIRKLGNIDKPVIITGMRGAGKLSAACSYYDNIPCILSQYIHTYFVFINISFIINKTLGKTTFRKT